MSPRLLGLVALLTACEPGKIALDGEPDVGQDSADTGDTADSGDSGDTDDTGDDSGVVPPPDILVDCEGSADYTEIQPAIEASVSGDRIGVMPCEYDERLDFLGKTIEVYGIEGSAVTILDADLEGTAVNIETGEGLGTRFAGFTIEDGYDVYGASAIEVGFSTVELEDLLIAGNGEGNSVIEILTGWVDMKDVVIRDNEVGEQAINVDAGILVAEGLDVDCDGGEQAIWHHVALNLDRSRIVCDSGYGIVNYHGTSIIQRSYIYGGVDGIYSYDEEGTVEDPDDPSEENFIYNSAIGGGERGVNTLYQYVIIENSVLWGGEAALTMTACNTSSYAMNTAFVESACGIEGDQAFSQSYSAFHGNRADGCGVTVAAQVTGDPMFTDFPDDLTLQAGSPLIDAGNPSAGYEDPDGSVNDIGIYGGRFGE